jgi:hypothetical protein
MIAELSLQLHAGAPPKKLRILGKNGWRLLSGEQAIELKPLVDYYGKPLAELPVFDRLTISPVPPEPVKANRRARKRQAANMRASLSQAIDILPLALHFKGEALNGLLKRIRYRAKFFHGQNSLVVYLAACGKDFLTTEEHRTVLVHQETTALRDLTLFTYAPPREYKVKHIDSAYDRTLWEKLAGLTPSQIGSVPMPKIRWRLICPTTTVVMQPLAATDGLRVNEIPPFARIEVHPAEFGYPPNFATDHRDEMTQLYDEHVNAVRSRGETPLQRDAWLQAAGYRAVWARYRNPELSARWLQTHEGVGFRLFRAQHYQGGIPNRDLGRIKFRADFFAEGTSQPLSIYLASCEPCCVTAADAALLGAHPAAPLPLRAPAAKRAARKQRIEKLHAVFDDDFTRATLRQRNGRSKTLVLEPEQTKLLKRIYDAPDHQISRTTLVKERAAGTQPEKYFRRSALKTLWQAKIIGKSKTGRLTIYWLRPFRP